MLLDQFESQLSLRAFQGLTQVVSWELILVHGGLSDDVLLQKHLSRPLKCGLENAWQGLIHVGLLLRVVRPHVAAMKLLNGRSA